MSDKNRETPSGSATDHGGTCPYCKESIKPEAVICKHCRSYLPAARTTPDHGGTCPNCKESINPEATVCKHCRSNLGNMAGASVAGVPFGPEAFLGKGGDFPPCGCEVTQNAGFAEREHFGARLSQQLRPGGIGSGLGAYEYECRLVKGEVCDAQGCRPWWVVICRVVETFM